jgi:glycerate dehydrogenase
VYDNVDVAYCRQSGIAVSTIRNYAVHTVPEHAFALILALRRNLVGVRPGCRGRRLEPNPRSSVFLRTPSAILHGATLGIIGAGAIGRATAGIGAAFGMRVLFAEHGSSTAGALEVKPLDELLRQSDVVSLHCPLLPATRNLIDIAAFRKMKRTALLINTARGGLVDEAALLQALDEHLIAGAGCDVLTLEPPRDGNPLLDVRRPNLIVTPHVAWASEQAMQLLADQLIDNIECWAAGKPRHLVTS